MTRLAPDPFESVDSVPSSALARRLSPLTRFAALGEAAARGVRRMGRAGLDLLLPPGCMACRAAVSEPGTLCAACWSALTFITPPYCDRRGTPVFSGVAVDSDDVPPAYDRARAAVLFCPVARDLVHGLKYSDRLELADPLAGLMARAGREVLEGADGLVPVPLHPLRLLRRRFNQSALLALGIERRSGVPMRADLLVRRRATTPQVGLDREARARNVAGAFAVPEAARPEIEGRALVLVDDVRTTGATIDACAKALRRAGARRVDVLTFALVPDTGTPVPEG